MENQEPETVVKESFLQSYRQSLVTKWKENKLFYSLFLINALFVFLYVLFYNIVEAYIINDLKPGRWYGFITVIVIFITLFQILFFLVSSFWINIAIGTTIFALQWVVAFNSSESLGLFLAILLLYTVPTYLCLLIVNQFKRNLFVIIFVGALLFIEVFTLISGSVIEIIRARNYATARVEFLKNQEIIRTRFNAGDYKNPEEKIQLCKKGGLYIKKDYECVLTVAVENKDIRFCKKYESWYIKLCEDEFMKQQASSTLQTNCDQIEDSMSRFSCYQTFIPHVEIVSSMFCDEATSSQCLSTLATMTGDWDICNDARLNSSEKKSCESIMTKCLENGERYTHNSKCSLKQINIPPGVPLAVCLKKDNDKQDCYLETALKDKDPSVCSAKKSSFACIYSFMQKQDKTNIRSYCDKITIDNERAWCYFTFLPNTEINSSTYCIGAESSSCLIRVATTNGDWKVCNDKRLTYKDRMSCMGQLRTCVNYSESYGINGCALPQKNRPAND